jgi:CheY-like chemotaxis protein
MTNEKYTILYIEDNGLNRQLMRMICLKREDINLITAEDAESGLKLATKMNFDLVFTDISLPGIDGYEVLARLKRDPHTRNIPVIAVSGDLLKPVDGTAPCFDAYLAKPFQMKTFNATLDMFLRQ